MKLETFQKEVVVVVGERPYFRDTTDYTQMLKWYSLTVAQYCFDLACISL